MTLKFSLTHWIFLGKSNLYQKYSLALLSGWGRSCNAWHASFNLQDSWQHHLRNYTFVLVFFRNRVLKMWPLVCNHRLSDWKWIQLSAGGAQIFNVKHPRIPESSIAYCHVCLKVILEERFISCLHSSNCQPIRNIYLFFLHFKVGNNISLYVIKTQRRIYH